MSKSVSGSKSLWRNYAYAFFKDFAFFSAVLVPFFTEWGGLTLFQVQLIQSWFSFWVFMMEVPTGAVADKIGRKYSLSLGSFIIAIAVIIYGSIPRFEFFLLSEFLFAVGYALTSGADQALIYDTLKEANREDEAKKVLGRIDSIHLLGMALAAPIGSLIAAKFGLNAPQIATSIPLLIASAIAFTIPEPKLHTGGSLAPKYLDIVKSGFRSLRHSAVVRTLAIDSVLVSGAAYFVVWFYQPLLKNSGFSLSYFGFAHALLMASEIMVSSNFHLFEKLLGKDRAYLKNSAIIVTLTFLAAGFFPNLWTTLALIVLGGGVGYTRATYISAIANRFIGARQRATVLSTVGMVRRFVLIILNPLIGYLATGSLSYALIAVGLLPLLTFVLKENIE